MNNNNNNNNNNRLLDLLKKRPPPSQDMTPVTLTDPDALACTICLKPLSIPVLQCKNGHLACSTCARIKNLCPSCCFPVEFKRCLALENILESISVSCTNSIYGCQEKFSYSKKLEHEQKCIFEPCSCPHPGCEFVSFSGLLYLHYYHSHSKYAIQFKYNTFFTLAVKDGKEFVVLQERKSRVLFVLTYGVQSGRKTANLTCIGPKSRNKNLRYELIARNEESYIKIGSAVEFISKRPQGIAQGKHLIVPSYFLNHSGYQIFEVCIQR